jgi:hypothetical protein
VDFPTELRGFRDYHRGETILVCGCGASLSEIIAPERLITIGVNDVGRLFDPDYLVVLNPPPQFTPDRFRYVAQSRAKAIFTQLNLPIQHPHIVRFRLGQRAGTDLSDADVLPYTRNSPYPALCLAMHMGARRIGLIGVDFTDHHFFGPTGKHVLSPEFTQIDQEYRNLNEKWSRHGVEIFNLSRESRLTAFPKIGPEEFLQSARTPQRFPERKIFFVNYKFLSCGDVFSDGLAHAASELGMGWQAAFWDEPQLPRQVQEFNPDLLFVVHGRRFCGRWPEPLATCKSGVWLLDEPYEVDDTCRFSQRFGAVFVNDPNTLNRHRNGHYLPVCYDPQVHTYSPRDERRHAVGFIGGANPRREEALGRLARRGLLSYVVGGPWKDPALRDICLSPNIPAEETARLYRSTRIIVNVFRSQHHYNHDGVPAVSMNPRVYEGLGCGALVISEHRPEMETACPELPVFRTLDEMESQIETHLNDPDLYATVHKACIRRMAGHTYSSRVASVLSTVLGEPADVNVERSKQVTFPIAQAAVQIEQPLLAQWDADLSCVFVEADGGVQLRKDCDTRPGGERGLIGKACYGNVELEFDLRLDGTTVFIAKIHQGEARNQLTNSYHLMCRGTRAYLARHNRVLAELSLVAGQWVKIALAYQDGAVIVRKDGAEAIRVTDRMLEAGYCFVGIKGGAARLRDIRVRGTNAPAFPASPVKTASWYRMLVPQQERPKPKVSIVTTVYDRIDCLERCIRSVQGLDFQDYEHIIVADAPTAAVLERMTELVRCLSRDAGNPCLTCLNERHNDWGISPAAAGLDLARGEYICFLSDDNGYLPRHFNNLIAALDGDANIGFAYSSCLYDGRKTLNCGVPRPAAIDLGQPLFRRELFDRVFDGKLPFKEFGWDWRMIERLLSRGVRWRHINDATFIFRLTKYPHLITGAAECLISYCIACYRPTYARQLIDDLIAKTSTAYEILLWINVEDSDFERYVAGKAASGAPVRVIGRSPDNIGMAAYPRLFEVSRGHMVAQIDDDVVCVSSRIAETAKEIFDRFPDVGMLTADVWQDEYTTGARPPMGSYRLVSREHGLYDGPIDGWFAVYRKSSLLLVSRQIRPSRYFCLGGALKANLRSAGMRGLLCTRMKVFHVVDPAYVAHFGMLDAEVAKYREIGRQDQVDLYLSSRGKLPPMEDLSQRVAQIRASMAGTSVAI